MGTRPGVFTQRSHWELMFEEIFGVCETCDGVGRAGYGTWTNGLHVACFDLPFCLTKLVAALRQEVILGLTVDVFVSG